MQGRYRDDDFLGMCLDSGAQRSVCGLMQARAYFKRCGRRADLESSFQTFKFGNDYKESLGKAEFRLPLPGNKYLPLFIDVVDADVPLLVGLDVLDSEQLIPDNCTNLLISKEEGWSLPITRKHGHMFVEWDAANILFTEAELSKLHVHFYHPSVDKLMKLLRRARPMDTTPDTRRLLQKISDNCKNCRMHSPGPFRFRASLT